MRVEFTHAQMVAPLDKERAAFLKEGSVGLFILGCVGRNEAFAIPFDWIHTRLDRLNITAREGGSHYHIQLFPNASGRLALRLNNGQNENIDQFGLILSH